MRPITILLVPVGNVPFVMLLLKPDDSCKSLFTTWKLRIQNLNYNKVVKQEAIRNFMQSLSPFFFGDRKQLKIVVKIFLDLHTFMPWLLDGFIGLIIRLFSWQRIPRSPIYWGHLYVAYPPFFKFCSNKTTPHSFCYLISLT